MRLLVYGMQSSGATAFSLFLAQRPGCLGLVDILNNYAAPRLDHDGDVVAKVVMTTAYPLSVHQERYRPDKTLLFLRDPRDNFASLLKKAYRNHSGLIDEKFSLLDRVFEQRHSFDAVIRYEDFIRRSPGISQTMQDIGWPVDETFYAFRRTHVELAAVLWDTVPDLFNHFEFSYGNVQSTEVSPRFRRKERTMEMDNHLSRLCPAILDDYRRRDETDRDVITSEPK